MVSELLIRKPHQVKMNMKRWGSIKTESWDISKWPVNFENLQTTKRIIATYESFLTFKSCDVFLSDKKYTFSKVKLGKDKGNLKTYKYK